MNVDLSDIGIYVKDMLTDVVNDVTDPRVQQFVTEMLNDYATLGLMKADGSVDPSLIEEAENTIKARAESLAGLPDLVAADKRQHFLNIVARFSQLVVGTVFGVARAYAGLPPTGGEDVAAT